MKPPRAVYVNSLPAGTMTIAVLVTRRLRFRIWLAIRLIKLAGLLLNKTVETEVTTDERTDNRPA